jgi:hypothetical protein
MISSTVINSLGAHGRQNFDRLHCVLGSKSKWGSYVYRDCEIRVQYNLPQSARFRFLEGIAAALERTVSLNSEIENPGFSLELDKNGKAKVAIWHPRKGGTLRAQLRAGERAADIVVTLPKGFSDTFTEDNDA